MSNHAMASLSARCTAIVLFACPLTFAACGGTNSSSVGGAEGSAVAMTADFQGMNFAAKDAASAVIPPNSIDSVNYGLLALIYSNTTGICQQSNNANFGDDTIFYLAVLQDAAGSASPGEGVYDVIDSSTYTGSSNSSDGIAQVVAASTTVDISADGGSINIALQTADQPGGTTSGSISATMSGTTVLNGKFEAPQCDALIDLVVEAFGGD